MSSERSLVASCLKSREAYEKIAGHLEEDSALGEQAKIVLRHVGQYYDRDPDAARVDPELLSAQISREFLNQKHQRMFSDLVQGLFNEDVSPANVVHNFISIKREAAAARLATALAAGKSEDEIEALMDEYATWKDVTDLESEDSTETLKSVSVRSLVEERVAPGAVLRMVPRSLNARLGGGLLRGHHVVVFARPEVGKSMFVINAGSGFLRQGLRVLYIGNEDPIQDVVMRFINRLSGMPRADVMENPERAEELARENGYDNLTLVSLFPGTPREIEKLVEEHSPDVLIVDQLRTVRTKEDTLTRSLEEAAKALRQIGRRHDALVISVVQAGDSASGKSVLDMGDVDSSNTGIPGACDVLIGIGMSRDDELAGRRVISLAKNKPGDNHEAFPVRICTATSKVTSL